MIKVVQYSVVSMGAPDVIMVPNSQPTGDSHKPLPGLQLSATDDHCRSCTADRLTNLAASVGGVWQTANHSHEYRGPQAWLMANLNKFL